MPATMKMYEFVEARKEVILANCLKALRRSRQGQTDEELLNDLGHFIDGFIALLRRDASAEKAETVQDTVVREYRQAAEAAERGLTRRSQGFDITRVVHDYGVLCDKLNELAAAEGQVFPSRDHQLMNIFLDEAMARGIEAFAAATAAEEREERAAVLGTLAHEIRNAACAATLAFSLIRKGQVGASGRTGDMLQRALTRIESLVQNALAEAKLQGKIPLRRGDVALAEALGQLAESALLERGIKIALHVAPGTHVLAEPGLLVSAVGNLLQNAIKFTRDGETIHLRATQTAEATTIEVEDRCGGLPAGRAQSLFQPFVQGADDPRGVGLGLHIVRTSVEAHGGSVSVQDLPGVGCIFKITLPRDVPRRQAAPGKGSGSRKRTSPRSADRRDPPTDPVDEG